MNQNKPLLNQVKSTFVWTLKDLNPVYVSLACTSASQTARFKPVEECLQPKFHHFSYISFKINSATVHVDWALVNNLLDNAWVGKESGPLCHRAQLYKYHQLQIPNQQSI